MRRPTAAINAGHKEIILAAAKNRTPCRLASSQRSRKYVRISFNLEKIVPASERHQCTHHKML